MISLWIIGAIAAAIVVGVVTWHAISEWLAVAKSKGTWAKIIKDRLENGDFVVVGGVFDDQENIVEQRAWRAKDLDEELRKRFYGHNQYTIHF